MEPNFNISDETFIGETSGSNYTDGSLASETTYYYKVIAIDSSQNVSEGYKQIKVKTLPVPIKIDSDTKGNWIGNYGKDGYIIFKDKSENNYKLLPSYLDDIFVTGNSHWYWDYLSGDENSLLISGGESRNIYQAFSAESIVIKIDAKDQNRHSISLYGLDPENSRGIIINATDSFGNNIIPEYRSDEFSGKYITFNYSGDTVITITYSKGPNITLAGIFFDGAINNAQVDTESVKGDANGDGNVDVIDLVNIKKTVANKEYNAAADLNSDGSVNALDLTNMRKYLLGKIKEF